MSVVLQFKNFFFFCRIECVGHSFVLLCRSFYDFLRDSNPESFELMVAHCAGFNEVFENS